MAASEFTLEAVKEFMINNGGKVTNQQLVTHFKAFLNDPVSKVKNREKFKDYVNELANIKVEDNDKNQTKILMLKKKYRLPLDSQQPVPAPRQSRVGNHQVPEESAKGDDVDGMGMSKVHSEEYYDRKIKVKNEDNDSGNTSLSGSTSTVASSDTQMTQPSTEEELQEANESISVKDRAKHLNKMESESDMLVPNQFKKKTLRDKSGDDDDDHHSSSFATYGAAEKEWMIVCASADYHEMNRLLSKNTSLAKVKDFTNGYTALHWAAKHGQLEVVKLLAGKPGLNINHRSYGGYTALHLAAMHGHEDAIQLLVQNYKANSNIRDFSGKKAKQYLKNSANSKTQQLLLSRRIGTIPKVGQSLDDSFLRTTMRKSNRSKAISSLLQATASAVHRSKSTILRSSWGSSSEDITEEQVFSNSGGTSPVTGRKASLPDSRDTNLMPPPSAPTQRRNKNPRSSSRENMTQSASAIDQNSLSQLRHDD